ncbi:MAG: hydrogenase 3 maturation endopeptidase HyCI [Anaerolineales bacterium]
MEKIKILKTSWQESLRQTLSQLKNEQTKLSRVAIVGIGNPLRKDDIAGVLVASELLKRECSTDANHFLVIQAGHAPENVTGELRDFHPNLIILIDAADMRAEPGTICWVPIQFIEGMSASTHSLPLSMLARYLTLELNCAVVLIGIQPKSTAIGEAVNPEVLAAVNEIVEEISTDCLAVRTY